MINILTSKRSKIALLIILITAIIAAVISYKSLNHSVSLTYVTKSYSPLMSSSRGIEVKAHANSFYIGSLKYYWSTKHGSFLDSNNVEKKDIVTNEDSSVIWSAVENGSVVDIKNKFQINLKVINEYNGKVFCEKNITIIPDKNFYTIK